MGETGSFYFSYVPSWILYPPILLTSRVTDLAWFAPICLVFALKVPMSQGHPPTPQPPGMGKHTGTIVTLHHLYHESYHTVSSLRDRPAPDSQLHSQYLSQCSTHGRQSIIANTCIVLFMCQELF